MSARRVYKLNGAAWSAYMAGRWCEIRGQSLLEARKAHSIGASRESVCKLANLAREAHRHYLRNLRAALAVQP